jgi:hypothetical protein
VAEHLQYAYVLTAHTIQGATVEWAGVVGRPEDFTRNWSYTALSRARAPTELFVVDNQTERDLDRAEIAPDQPAELGDERTPIERLQTAMRRRDDEDLADQLHAARTAQAEAQRVADTALARIAQLEQPALGKLGAGARTWPNARWSANASSSPRTKSLRPLGVSATSRAASPTARHGRPNAAYSANERELAASGDAARRRSSDAST